MSTLEQSDESVGSQPTFVRAVSKRKLEKEARKTAEKKRRKARKIAEYERKRREHAKLTTEDSDSSESGDDLDFVESSYYSAGGLRHVYPYWYTYRTNVKQRWLGRKLAEVLNTEFFHGDGVTAEELIERGQITLSTQCNLSPDHVLEYQSGVISSRQHRHEPPVLDEAVNIVHSCSDFLVVNKSASLPIHPCGQYRINSLLGILRKEHNYKHLLTVHRLDRLTSGIVVFLKDYKRALRVQQSVRDREVSKEYLCLVAGEFPVDPQTVDIPLVKLSQKMGIMRVGREGEKDAKSSRTVFTRVGSSVDGCSLVRATPVTGRTHQIRVHLQYLGYPIENDPLYNTPVWGPSRGAGGDYGENRPEEDLVKDLEEYHMRENVWNRLDNSDDKISVKSSESVSSATCPPYTPELDSCEPTCYMCKSDFQSKRRDPRPEELLIYLHALKYSSQDSEEHKWSFATHVPRWAKKFLGESELQIWEKAQHICPACDNV